MARRLKLPTAHRPESQEICFVPDDVLSAFFKKYSARCLRPGPIVTTRGQKIGEHQGLLLYTLGQRKGVWAGGGGPYYVLKKDLRNNTLMVTSDRTDLLASGCCLRDFNWLVEPKTNPRSLVAQVRYRAPAVDAQVAGCGTRVHLRFRRPQWAVTAGQSAVLYVGERVVGGGIVDKVSSE
jgi:tRNA-specific 2-thiouridylase